MLEYLFNKVAGLKVSNFIKTGLQHRCFPANIAKFLRTPFLKNIFKWLLLHLLHALLVKKEDVADTFIYGIISEAISRRTSSYCVLAGVFIHLMKQVKISIFFRQHLMKILNLFL